MKKIKLIMRYIASYRIWIITILLLNIFFIFLAWTAYPKLFFSLVPYLLVTVYFLTAAYAHSIGYYLLAILIPSVVEKAVLYFLGAFLYNISPLNFNSVFEVISSQKPYVNLFPQPSATVKIQNLNVGQ